MQHMIRNQQQDWAKEKENPDANVQVSLKWQMYAFLRVLFAAAGGVGGAFHAECVKPSLVQQEAA